MIPALVILMVLLAVLLIFVGRVLWNAAETVKAIEEIEQQ
jgi:hypothetical protein